LHREYYLLTIEVSNATASTNCVAICFGMNTKSNASNKPFLIAGRFAIISLAALCRRENSWNKFSRRGADRKLTEMKLLERDSLINELAQECFKLAGIYCLDLHD
jgi:hypothetical protein